MSNESMLSPKVQTKSSHKSMLSGMILTESSRKSMLLGKIRTEISCKSMLFVEVSSEIMREGMLFVEVSTVISCESMFLEDVSSGMTDKLSSCDADGLSTGHGRTRGYRPYKTYVGNGEAIGRNLFLTFDLSILHMLPVSRRGDTSVLRYLPSPGTCANALK